MGNVDIRRLDFTQLLMLASLLRTRKATATAAELGMTQSTVSHGLQRLRDLLGDELFVRRPHGLEPTPRALALRPSLEALFAHARDVLEAPGFDPASAEGTLRIAGADLHCALLAGPLVARLAVAAPGLRVAFRPLVRREAVDAVLAGEVDLAVGRFWRLPPAVVVRHLFDETYAVVVRKGHPTVRAPLGLPTYLAARHVVVSLDGSFRGIVDEVLGREGRERDVVSVVPYFLAALATAASTDAVVTLPARLARAYAARFELDVLEPPLELPAFRVSAIQARATAGSGLVAWAMEELASLGS